MKRKTVFLAIPCPVTMRNMLVHKASTYNLLREAGVNVVLLVPEAASKLIQDLFKATVECIPAPKPRTKLQELSDFITKHLNMTNMQILASKYGVRHNVSKISLKSHLHSLRLLIAYTLGKIYWFRIYVAPKIHFFAYRERPLKKIFDKYNPDLVFVPNLGNLDGEEVLRESRRQNILTIGMVGSWDHPHKKYQAVQAHKIFVWSEAVKREAVNLQSYKPENVYVVGAPHYDMFLDKDLLLSREALFTELGLDNSKKLISCYSGTGRTPDEGDIVDMILKWNDTGKLSNEAQIYIRTYPGDTRGDHIKFDQFEGRPDVFIDWLEQDKHFSEAGPQAYLPDREYMKRLISVYYHSDIVINSYSSVCVEASIFLKPTVNVNFDGYKTRPYRESLRRFELISHFDKLFASGGITQANSQEELLEAINRFLNNPQHNIENLKRLREAVCGNVDGRAGERIAKHILEWV